MIFRSRIAQAFLFSLGLIATTGQILNAQSFNRQDSLRGTLSDFRSCIDVHHYQIDLDLDIKKQTVKGEVIISYEVLQNFSVLQLDLFENLSITSVSQNGNELAYTREGNAFFVRFEQEQPAETTNKVLVKYEGSPVKAIRPPWDGGFVWEKDHKGRFSLGVACEGLGASAWWPCKDHPSDEPDSLGISVAVPRGMKVICNGQFVGSSKEGNKERFSWKVTYPINLYNVTMNVGFYSHFSEKFKGEEDTYDLNYYVWEGNEEKAKEHFKQVREMLKIFESSFGPFPWPRDGYALVETSYWGMEHQSAIAYGNDYQNNDFDFDFIIIHESGHEWFGNAVSISDHADLWIHESFTTYMEAVYLEKRFNKERAIKYLLTQRNRIAHDNAMLGPRDVNFDEHSIDIYFKGAWMIHTLREALGQDELWFSFIKKLSMHFRQELASTEAVIDFFQEELAVDFSSEIEFYLKNKDLPVLDYSITSESDGMWFERRWNCPAATFDLPVLLAIDGEEVLFSASKQTQRTKLDASEKNSVKVLSDRMLFQANSKNH